MPRSIWKKGELKLLHISYHRNGVMGQPFREIHFTQRVGRNYVPMMAIIFEGDGYCAVMALEKTGCKFRGDEYEDTLREWIREEYAEPREADYRPEDLPRDVIV